MLVPPHLSFYCIDRDCEAYDYGTNEYVYPEILDRVNPMIMRLFPRAEWLVNRVEARKIEAGDKILNGEFSCIAITDGRPCRITCEFIENTEMYERYSEVDLKTGSQVWHTYIYTKK